MTTGEAILLGALQGLTEFLPVSSDGHLVLAAALLGLEQENYFAFEVLLHLGSLLAIFIVFWRDIVKLFLPRPNLHGFVLLFVASLPAAIAGLTLKLAVPDSTEAWVHHNVLANPTLAAFGLLATSLILWIGSRERPAEITFEGTHRGKVVTALLIGVAQALAILPGVSRSGSTISTALTCKWVRADAVKLSFLMGMIAIGGAGLLEARKIQGLAQADPAPLVAGFLASLVFSLIGLTAIKFVVLKGKLRWFAAYAALAGCSALVWLSLR